MSYKVKDANKSSLNTKNKIKNAFLKLLHEKGTADKITVKELCQEADIQRSTFYIHYKDIYHVEDYLIESFYKTILAMIPESIRNAEDVKSFFMSTFDYVFENKSVLETMFHDRDSIELIQSAKVKIKKSFSISLSKSEKEVKNALAIILFNGTFTSVYEILTGVSRLTLEEIRDQALRVTNYLFVD